MLNSHSKTPKESLYLETGTIPIRYIIKQRRLSYLHHLLTRNKKELISQVFFAQKRKSVKNDWVKLIEDDLKEVKINVTKESISKMKKFKF